MSEIREVVFPTIDYRASETSARPLTDAERDLAESHYDLVEDVVALMIKRGTLIILDFDNAVGDGMVGLCQATKKYDPDSGVEFGAYARHCIRGAVIDAQRVFHKTNRETKVAHAISLFNNSGSLSLSQPATNGSDNHRTIGDTLVSKEQSVEDTVVDLITYDELKTHFEESLTVLTPIQRHIILALRSGKPKVLIAQELDVCHRTVKVQSEKAMAIIRSYEPGLIKRNEEKQPRVVVGHAGQLVLRQSFKKGSLEAKIRARQRMLELSYSIGNASLSQQTKLKSEIDTLYQVLDRAFGDTAA